MNKKTKNYTYVVKTSTGFYEAINKKDAIEIYDMYENAEMIKLWSKEKNYDHNRIHVVMSK